MKLELPRPFFLIVSIALVILTLGLQTYGGDISAEEGEKLTQKALSLNSKKINRWLKPVLKKYGRKAFTSKTYHEKLQQEIAKVERDRSRKNFSSHSVNDFPKDIPPPLSSVQKRYPRGPPTGFRPKLTFPMYTGMLGQMATFSQQETAMSDASPMGGAGPTGGPGAARGLGGNSQSIMASANMMITPSHSINASYMHSFIKDLPKEGTPVNDKSDVTITPPKDMLSVGYSYAYRLSQLLRYSFNLNYSNAMGFNDSNLSLIYNDRVGEDPLRSLNYNLGLSATLPLSQISKTQGKITTVSMRGGLVKNLSAWNYQLNGQYSYTFYNKEETEASIMESFPVQGSPPPQGPPPEGDQEFPDSAPAFAPIDINFLSRETARTSLNTGFGYRFNRQWNLGSKLDVSYRYLESTYSMWTTSLQVLSLGYRYGKWNTSAGMGLRSDSTENFEAPKNFSVNFSLIYMIGAGPAGGSSGPPMESGPEMGGGQGFP